MPVLYQEGLFPPTNMAWDHLVPLIGPAVAEVARLDGLLAVVPNPQVLNIPLRLNEAQYSSRIEGTRAPISEVLTLQAGGKAVNEDSHEAAREVLNCHFALLKAEKLLSKLPLCLRVVREMHSVLMDGVRGQHQAAGEFRKVPNWIGPPGSTIHNASYVPISADRLPTALSAWERFMHAEFPDKLVQLAVLHAEFEAIHPFLDGNGRVGRMLVPLFLWQVGLTRNPIFYMSSYLEGRRTEYYGGLLSVSRDHDWTPWCHFFLEATLAQASAQSKRVEKILDLHRKMQEQLSHDSRSRFNIAVLNWIFERPVFYSTQFTRDAGIPKQTATRLLRNLLNDDILVTITPARGRRPRLVAFTELLEIIHG